MSALSPSFLFANNLSRLRPGALNEIFLRSTLPPPGPAGVFPGAFTAAQIGDVTPAGTKVFQNASPPDTDSETNQTYQYFPITSAVTQNIQSVLSSTWTGGAYHFIWGNRSNSALNGKPNLIFPAINMVVDGVTYNCRTQYTTRAKADASVLGQVRYSIGAPADGGSGYDDAWSDLTAVDWATLAASPADYFTTPVTWQGITYMVATDLVYIPTGKIVDSDIGEGITLDLEMQDGRTPQQLYDFLSSLCAEVHAADLKVMSFNNALNSTGAARTGFDVSINYLLHQSNLDYIGCMAWSGNSEGNVTQSMLNQFATLTGPLGDQEIDYSKVFGIFELNGTTVSDAAAMQTLISDGTHSMDGWWLWRNGALQGYPLSYSVNQKIATLLGLPTT